MKIIDKKQYCEAFDGMLSECFEMFFEQRYYLEVLHNGEMYYMHFSDCKECDYNNASCYFEYYHKEKKYASDIDKHLIKSEYYEFSTLESAREYALQLMTTRKYND